MLSAEHMRTLPEFFADIPDPRRGQGCRHPLPVVLAIAAAAVLCGMRGYKAISQWAEDLSQTARARFRCRYRKHRYEVPSRTVLRDALMRVDPLHLDCSLREWNAQFGAADQGLAIDGKTACVTPSTRKDAKHTSSVSSATKRAPVTPKKSRYPTRR